VNKTFLEGLLGDMMDNVRKYTEDKCKRPKRPPKKFKIAEIYFEKLKKMKSITTSQAKENL